MKTNTQKIVEEWEKKKKKVKEVSYYKNTLLQENQKMVEKIYKVLEIIKEEMALSVDDEKYQPPFGALIDKNKLLENKILVSDFKKIIDLLSSSLYLVLPKNKGWLQKEEIEEMEEKIFILFPINDWDYDAQEPCFKYPHEKNFKNFNEAMEEILKINEGGRETTPKTKLKDRKNKNFNPFCIEEKMIGYFKFYKQGKKMKIGSIKSRHFRLLQSLSEPFGVSKTVGSLFEAIRLPKDIKDTTLSNFNTEQSRKVEIIKYTIKELQKNKGLQGKLRFRFDDQKTVLRLELL